MPKVYPKKNQDPTPVELESAVMPEPQPIPTDLKPVFPTLEVSVITPNPMDEFVAMLVDLPNDDRMEALSRIFTALGVDEEGGPAADAVTPSAWLSLTLARCVDARRRDGKDIPMVDLRDEWTSFIAGTTESQRSNVRHELSQAIAVILHQINAIKSVTR
jgi:hypothetical protein